MAVSEAIYHILKDLTGLTSYINGQSLIPLSLYFTPTESLRSKKTKFIFYQIRSEMQIF